MSAPGTKPKYRLITTDWQYLHSMDFTLTTKVKAYAWCGSAVQMRNVRKRFPETKRLLAVRVS